MTAHGRCARGGVPLRKMAGDLSRSQRAREKKSPTRAAFDRLILNNHTRLSFFVYTKKIMAPDCVCFVVGLCGKLWMSKNNLGRVSSLTKSHLKMLRFIRLLIRRELDHFQKSQTRSPYGR